MQSPARTGTENRITRTGAVGWLLLVFVLGFSPAVWGADGNGPDSRVVSLAGGVPDRESTFPDSISESLHYQGPTGRKPQTAGRVPVARDFEPDGNDEFLIAPPDFETSVASTIRSWRRRGDGNPIPSRARSRSDFSRAPPLLQG